MSSDLLQFPDAALVGLAASHLSLAPSQLRIRPLAAGNASQCHLLESGSGADRRFHVLKLRRQGGLAESRVLRRWNAAGVSVPSLLHCGEVPGGRYLLMDAVLDEHGEPAPDGYDFQSEAAALSSIAGAAGRELAKIHGVVADGPFGGFADTWMGENSRHGSWKASLGVLLRGLVRAATGAPRVTAFEAEFSTLLDTVDLPQTGTFVHGDYGLHNVLVKSLRPLRTVVLDPNPLIADPYLDVAGLANRGELNRAKSRAGETPPGHARGEGDWFLMQDEYVFRPLLAAYTQATGRPLDPTRLQVHQFIVLMQMLAYRKGLAGRERLNSWQRGAVRDVPFMAAMAKDKLRALGLKPPAFLDA